MNEGELLKQAIEVSLLLCDSLENEEKRLCNLMENLLLIRSSVKFAFTKPELHYYLTRLIQQLIDTCFPITAPNNLYIKIQGMSKQQQVEFFDKFLTHYELMFLALENEKTAEYRSKYDDIVNKLSSSSTSELQNWQYILLEDLPIIVKHKRERIKVYQYFLDVYNSSINNNNNNCNNGDTMIGDLQFLLRDMIQANEYELFKAYINTFNQSSYILNDNSFLSILDEACCVQSIEIIKYLIETVGIDYRARLEFQKLPIVYAVEINNIFKKRKKRNNTHQHGDDDDDNDKKKIEEKKQRSREIVEYIVGLYKRDNCFNSFLLKTSHSSISVVIPNDIVQTAYTHANIPVLLYLKEIGLNITGSLDYLYLAVKSSSIEAVRLFLSNFKPLPSNDNNEEWSKMEADVQLKFNNALFKAATKESFEILNVFIEEFGIDCCKFPIILGAARLELLYRFDFSNYIIDDDDHQFTLSFDTSGSGSYILILRKLLSSRYFSVEYLEAMFSHYPSFKPFFEKEFIRVVKSIFEVFFCVNEMKRVKLFRKLISIPELFPIVRLPCLSYWASSFSKLR